MSSDLPTIDELALGAFLHDAGKLLQRGMRPVDSLPERVRGLTEVISPVRDGRHSHWHVLYTELLFHDLAEARRALPGGLDRERVRAAAVHHHRPDSRRPWTVLVQAADRLSSGMDRKARDEDEELTKGPAAFRRQPLRSVLSGIRLDDFAAPAPLWLRPRPADAETIVGAASYDTTAVEADYAATAAAYRAAFQALCEDLRQPPDILHEGAIALGERFWWAVPSSTVDQPDVPLLDHSLSVAAFAACLHAHHAPLEELENETAIGNADRPKFRLLRGDLSGIQSTLFRLAAQQVEGVNRILRARSFLMGQVVEAAALLIRRELGLPPYVVLMRAGGQFTMLLPEIEGIEARIEAVRAPIEDWLVHTYAGDLGLVLGLTAPLAGRDFQRDRIVATLDAARIATEDAKQRALASWFRRHGTPVLGLDYERSEDGTTPEGACPACGVRPCRPKLVSHGVARCYACHHEHAIGQLLPSLEQCLLIEGKGEGDGERGEGTRDLVLFDRMRLRIVREGGCPFAPGGNILSAWKPRGAEREIAWPIADRWLANHVPTFKSDPAQDPRYAGLVFEAGETFEPGDLATMAHLAADAREVEGDRVVGRAMLGVLKADVDDLGAIFAFGLKEDRSIGRLVALSRTLDAFFTARLPHLLQREFSETYTVYAGGDDLLLIGPWRQTIRLAAALRAGFGDYAGGNPSLRLSAGLELVDGREPLNRSADRAEARLERAKGRTVGGKLVKDGIALFGETMGWDGLPWLLEAQDELCRRLREGGISTAFAYQLLRFAAMKAAAEDQERPDTRAAIWRARYGYALARRWPNRDEFARETPFFHGLLGLDGKAAAARPARAALSMALWRNR